MCITLGGEQVFPIFSLDDKSARFDSRVLDCPDAVDFFREKFFAVREWFGAKLLGSVIVYFLGDGFNIVFRCDYSQHGLSDVDFPGRDGKIAEVINFRSLFFFVTAPIWAEFV